MTEEALRFALARIEDFYNVQKEKPFSEKLEAVSVLREGLGLTDDLTNELSKWSAEFNGPGFDGALTMGVLIGLFVAQHEAW